MKSLNIKTQEDIERLIHLQYRISTVDLSICHQIGDKAKAKQVMNRIYLLVDSFNYNLNFPGISKAER
jgi:hypothetical protein